MARTKRKAEAIADAILISDPHLRLDTPVCRTDDILEAQQRKWEFIRELADKHDCPVLCAGDVYHKWNATSKLNVLAMQMIPRGMLTIAGQHDLPGHNFDRVSESGLGVLDECEHVCLLEQGEEEVDATPFGGVSMSVCGFNWDAEFEPTTREKGVRKIALIHHFVYKGKEPFPGAAEVGNTARRIMRQLKGYDLIVSGDNHQTFTEEWNDQLLVNPGSMIRSTAAQIDFKPSCFLYYAETNTVRQVFLPIEKGVVSRDHIDLVAGRDERIEAFTTRLRHDVEIGFSFESNMTTFLKKNKVRAGVQEIIEEAMQ